MTLFNSTPGTVPPGVPSPGGGHAVRSCSRIASERPGPGFADISNWRRIGFAEYELIQDMVSKACTKTSTVVEHGAVVAVVEAVEALVGVMEVV